MDKILALLGDHLPCFLFQQLFLKRLPEDMRAQLIGTNIDHQQLATRADKIWAARQMQSYANSIQIEPSPTSQQILPATSNLGHTGGMANAVQRQPRIPPKPRRKQPPASAITTACLVRRLAEANNRVDGQEMSRLGVSRGHDVQPQGGPAFCMRQDLWRPFFCWHRSGSRRFPVTRIITQTAQPGASLVAANGSTIRVFGLCTVPLPFALKQYRWDFIIAEVSHPYWVPVSCGPIRS